MVIIFRRILCAGFLIGLVNAGMARSIISGASAGANDQVAQNPDSKTQERSSDPTWILTGKIGGKYALLVKIHRKDDQISGSYRYVNNPKAAYLVLRGAIDKSGSAELTEYDSSDRKTGIFKGVFSGDIIGQNSPTKFSGVWTNAITAVSFEFDLTAKAAEKTSPTASTALDDSVHISGKLHILRNDPDNPVPEYPSIDSDCCYYKQPLITGEQPERVLRKIRKALDLETVFGDTIESLIEQLHDKDDQGKSVPNLYRTNIDYEEVYNANYILSFTYVQFDDSRGKYRTYYYPIVIDLKTGNVVKAEDVFRPNLTRALERMVKLRFQKALRAHMDEAVKSGYPEMEQDYDYFKEDLARDLSLDNFAVDDQGVTFEYSYKMSPAYPEFDREVVKFSYEELKKYINPKGILGRLILK
jgi:hypothetical protein